MHIFSGHRFYEPDGNTGAGGGTAAGAADTGGVQNPAGGGPAAGPGSSSNSLGSAPAPADPFGAGTDSKTAGGNVAGATGSTPPAASATVPENYEFKLAEGLTMSDDLKNQFTEIAKSANLSQEAADKLMTLHGSVMLGALKEAQKTQNDWADECQKQGLYTDACKANAKLAVDTFGGGAAVQALVKTGAVYNPAVWKMLTNIGSLLQEDNGPDGKPPAGQKSLAEIMFPNSK